MNATRMLSVGAVVLTLTAVTGCRASTRVALDGGVVDKSVSGGCQEAEPSGLEMFLGVDVKNESGVTADVTGVSMAGSSPLRLVDWWLVPAAVFQPGSNAELPSAKPKNSSTVVRAGDEVVIAMDVRNMWPDSHSEWLRGFDVAYRTSRGTANVIAKSSIAVAPRGGSCAQYANPGA